MGFAISQGFVTMIAPFASRDGISSDFGHHASVWTPTFLLKCSMGGFKGPILYCVCQLWQKLLGPDGVKHPQTKPQKPTLIYTA